MPYVKQSKLFFAITFSLILLSGNVFAQTDTSGAEALGRAVGSLLGNIFSKSSGESGNSGAEPVNQFNSNQGPDQNSLNAFKEKDEEIKSYINGLCASEQYTAFFKKTPCHNSQLLISHFADESKVTAAEKKAIALIDAEYLKVAQMQVENYKANLRPQQLGLAIADSRMKFRNDAQKNLHELYSGKITWGQYNSKRREISEAGRAEFIRISQGANR